MVAASGRLPTAPTGFADRAQTLLAQTGTSAHEIEQTVETAQRLIAEVRASCTA
jgi:hypothetical protein